jgi:competence protein ComEC
MAKADLVFAGASSFLIGVFIAGFTANGFFALAIGLCLFCVSLWQSRFFKSIFRYSLIAISLSLLFFGFFYYHFFLTLREESRLLPSKEEKTFSGVVRNDPRVRNGTMRVALELEEPLRGEIEVLLPEYAPIAYGDKVEFEGAIEAPRAPHEDPTAVFPKVISSDSGYGNGIKRALIGFKHKMLSVFNRTLGKDSSALMAGITLGEQSGFSKELRAEMAASGTTHLVALSGYNIAILVMALEKLLRGRVRKRILGILMITAIALFVAMVGGEASIARAALMGGLLVLAKQTGREHDMRNAITITAAGMVLLDPRILTHDVGFVLSFVSLLGIVYLSPAISAWRGINVKEESLFDWKENAVMTLSAQLAVLPILMLVFGSASLAGVPANILILALVPATMGIGFLLGFIGLFFLPLAMLIAFVAEVFLRYEIFIIKSFALVSFPVENPFGGWAIFIVYYGLLIAFIVRATSDTRHVT